jgi:hypothetical protein
MRVHFGDCAFGAETRKLIRAGRSAAPSKDQLHDGDRIRLGNLELRFRASNNPGSTRGAQPSTRRS